MAQVSESGGRGRRGLNPEINLVPFIDLLSVCICFLLMTAVWLQVGAVDVKQAFGTAANELPPQSFEILVRLDGPQHAHLEFKNSKSHATALSAEIDGKTRVDLMTSLGHELERAAESLAPGRHSALSEVFTAATIKTHADAPYAMLVAVMDSLRRHQIVNLAVAPVFPNGGAR